MILSKIDNSAPNPSDWMYLHPQPERITNLPPII
jgi:hypothetical protein